MSLQAEYNQVKEKLIRAKALKDDALDKIKKEFDCNTIEEAESLLETMEKAIDEQEQILSDRLKKFRSKYNLGVDGEEDD